MKRTAALALGGVALIAAALWLFPRWRRPQTLEASGVVEAHNIQVGSKEGGRIQEVLVREGDQVKPGQTLVRFDEQPLAARLQQARGRVAQARAHLEMLQRGSRQEEIAEARHAAGEAAALLAERRAGYRREQIEQARAEVERARSQAQNAERTHRRIQNLAARGDLSRQAADDAETAWQSAQAQWKAAQQRLAELERGYRPEEVAQAEQRLGRLQAVEQRVTRGFRAEEIAAARAELERAEAEAREVEARLKERHVVAPAPATVEVLDVRPGDLIPPNTPVATLLERDQIYVRIYVPETRLGEVSPGQRAEVILDALPGRTFPALVEQINQQAEFLPRNVQTKEERVHQVFGVKLRVTDPGPIRPGMAATVRLGPREPR
jgi:multidrug resistance efflux pump